MLGKLNQYIFRYFFSVFVFFLLGLMGMLWLGQSVILIDQIVLRGESISTFFFLSGKLLPNIFMSVAPLAALGAALFALNQLASNGEIVVIRAAGLRPTKISIPFAILGLALTAILFVFSLYLAPKSNRELRASIQNIQINYSQNVILSGQFIFPSNGITVFANQSLTSGEMVDIFIEDRRKHPFIRTYFANRGLLQRENGQSKIALINGKIIDSNWETEEFSQIQFERTEISFDDADAQQNTLNIWTTERPSSELVESFKQDPVNSNKARGELMRRVTFPLLGLILPSLSALLFVSQPFSRHGYSKRIFFIAFIGLAITTIQLTIPILTENSFQNMWVGFIPSIGLIIAFMYARVKTN